jgi:hypothetical protein
VKRAVAALLLLAAALSATSRIDSQTAQGDAVERAAALFAEARTAIQRGGFREASSSMPAPWGQQYVRGGLLIELARRELKAFPNQAADDADTAFGMFLILPGGGPNVDLQPPVTPEKLARMGKMQAEPEAIRILLAAGRRDRALELARTADIDRSNLYDQVIRNGPIDRALELADECRAGDGTYPFAAVADVARAAQAGLPRLSSALLEKGYAVAGDLRDQKSRSMAIMFIQKTYDMVPPVMALRALERLAQDLSTAPPAASVNARSEADVLGPWILEVMSAVDRQRAAALAGDHPDWEAARNIPGRTPGNPVGRSPIGGGAIPPRPPGVPPAAPAARQGPPDFERDLQAARALPEDSARVMRLMQLAESLLKNLP